jgi:hypothetical protein
MLTAPKLFGFGSLSELGIKANVLACAPTVSAGYFWQAPWTNQVNAGVGLWLSRGVLSDIAVSQPLSEMTTLLKQKSTSLSRHFTISIW